MSNLQKNSDIPSSSLNLSQDKYPPKGEPLVWFSSLGLTVGLVMVLGLLIIIAINGFSVFWPKRLALATLVPESSAKVKDSNSLAGEVRQRQENAGARFVGKRNVFEKQFFVGNRDVYGFSFKFVPEEDISGIDYPKDIYLFKRIEYGDAIGFPTELKLEEGRVVAFDDTSFEKELQAAVEVSSKRRARIAKLEKHLIGEVNREMELLNFEQRRASPDRLKEIEKRRAELDAIYQKYADEAASLRQQQKASTLELKLADGTEKSLALGDIVSFRASNRIGFFERLGLTLSSIVSYLLEDPREANTEGGVFPAIFGTFVMTLLMSLSVAPFGVLAAIYLREYAKQGFFVRSVRIAVNNLAGVPSIVFGVFGLGFFVYLVGGTIDRLFFAERLPTPTYGTGGILWASLTLALMTVPVVIVATEEALSAVPRGMREGSLACGASKWQTIQRIVLPAAVPGIITGLILAMARGAGEVAPLMLVGVVKLAPTLPLDLIPPFIHLDRKFMHLGFHIYDLGFQSPDSEAAKPMVFATTLLLIALVVVLNLGAIMIREHLRKKYSTGAF